MFLRFSLSFALCSAVMLAPGVGFAQEAAKSSGKTASATEDKFRKLTEEVVAAEVSGDLAAMERFFTDDYIHTHSSGWIENKTEFMSLYKTGKRKYIAADISQVQVHDYGTSAIVNGREHINELNGDHQYLFQCVWVQQQGTWKLAAWVANPVPKKAGTPDNFK